MTRDELIQVANNLVVKYSNEKKLLPTEAIKYFIEKSLVSFGLEKYIIKFSVVKNKPYMGSYNQEEKSININMDIFEKKYLNDRECINLFPNETNRYLVVNMLLIGTIMHEITHARQYKSCCEHQKSIIAKLTSDGFDFDSYENKSNTSEVAYYKSLCKEYEKQGDFYNFLPMERMANIESYIFVIEMIKNVNYEKSNILFDYLDYKLISSIVTPYIQSKEKNPTLSCILIQNNIMKKNKVRIKILNKDYIKRMSKKMSFEQRIFYGLQINKEEYKILIKELKSNKIFKMYNKGIKK